MAAESGTLDAAVQGAMQRLPPGPLTSLTRGVLSVDLSPQAGGRIAQIRHRGIEQLFGPDDGDHAAIAWGCFPMVPWAGRIRHGRFAFDGRGHALPVNFGAHAIHGTGFTQPWTLERPGDATAMLTLELPTDMRWPFGGRATHCITLQDEDTLHLVLEVTAGDRPMPASLGWHPWFRKPDRIDFQPDAIFPRDAEGIATLPPAAPPPGPWDDCFVNRRPVRVHRGDTTLTMTSDCICWVVYDQAAHATCVEPQTAMPDAFNADPVVLPPGQSLRAWTTWRWT
ncbi:aldose epimerase [Luteimonas aestuarii]|uniref:Aldose epimerase n=1 Tax=Luteimonas aestuarii TaxID=453837 RepID=A0A4R5U4X2_9GAMM|nr:aldose epimerase [Luteimonas aestuarii]TDK28699.1 aldose epimerase [Luteimonas aestuarii]